MVNGSRYYRALESVSIASALSSALTIYQCQIRVHQRWQSKLQLLTGCTLQLERRDGGRPQGTVHPRRLPVNTVIHTTVVGLEPTTFRLLVRRATSSATDSSSAPTDGRTDETQLIKRSSNWWPQNNMYRRFDGAACWSHVTASQDQQNIVTLLIALAV